jgi:hypothetical protein
MVLIMTSIMDTIKTRPILHIFMDEGRVASAFCDIQEQRQLMQKSMGEAH